MDMLRSISKQSGESAQSVLKKKREGCGGKDLQKKEGFVGFYVGHKPQSARTNTAEPIEMLFGVRTRVGSVSHARGGGCLRGESGDLGRVGHVSGNIMAEYSEYPARVKVIR